MQLPLVLVPALGEIAAHQQQDTERGMSMGMMGRERDSAPVRRDRPLETLQ
jgi:hypothetical protein